MRPPRILIAALILAAAGAQADKIGAGRWTIKADARSVGSGVKVRGAVSGPLCKQLRLTVFTNGQSGWTGMATTTVKDVSGSRKFFDAYSAYGGGGRGVAISGANAVCISR